MCPSRFPVTDTPYEDLRLLAMILLDRAGGEISFTEKELTETDYYGRVITVTDDPATNSFRVKVREQEWQL